MRNCSSSLDWLSSSFRRVPAVGDDNGDGRVEFTGAVSQEEALQRLGSYDALLVPSLSRRGGKEQFGRALTEAMACEVPVVGSDSGEIARVIGDAGLVFPEGDTAALTERLQRLRDDPALRRDLAARGLARVRSRFTPDEIARQTVEVYRRVRDGLGPA